MNVIRGIVVANLSNFNKRKLLIDYGNALLNQPKASGSKAYYDAVEINEECKRVKSEIMNVESCQTLYPLLVDGKTASSAKEVYSLISERYGFKIEEEKKQDGR